ncbi:MAG TPA: sodium-translocating pyrophosphatase [bacterium (Candidatus Stahlbacteria)]|nr:sodium-translocating pyrophosphatase [Candidatus Stahlbacteria bacterium]
MIGIPIIVSLFALVVVAISVILMLKKSAGTEKMQELSHAIQDGARTFLRREYFYVVWVVIVMSLFLSLLSRWTDVNYKTAISFIIGAIASALAGYIAMSVGTRANARTAEAAKDGLKPALSVAFTGGATTGLSIVGIGLLGLCLVYILFSGNPVHINGYAMGASLLALFARAGGGIYTKGADMGADLVGKVEESIPEDDPRNPAVIADNVGDNVGDTAGLGADLLESYVESIIATIAIAVMVTAIKKEGQIFLPLYLASLGIIASIIGIFVVKGLRVREPQSVLNAGIYVSAILMILGSFFIIKFTGMKIGNLWAILSGLAAGIIIGWVSEVYTSSKYRPTRKLAESAQTGAAVTIVNGLGLGMGSTLVPVITIAAATLVAYHFVGAYGVALAAFGMLSILGVTLAVDSYGPVADNAGGIAEMAGLSPKVRKITDSLDAVGNTTAAIGKGFAVGSAAFAALGLLTAYLVTVNKFASNPITLSLTNPRLIAGLLVGGMVPYLFASLLASGVGKVAFKIIEEVRRQFREIPGLIQGKAKADSSKCVDIAAKGALQSMMLPGILAVIIPIAMGFGLGPVALAGLLMGSLVTGLSVGIQTANTGAALDNAKKYIEEGHFGGKGTPAHKAAVIGDTVGDPLKDTIGPSMNILIKLMAVISLVLAPVFATR